MSAVAATLAFGALRVIMAASTGACVAISARLLGVLTPIDMLIAFAVGACIWPALAWLSHRAVLRAPTDTATLLPGDGRTLPSVAAPPGAGQVHVHHGRGSDHAVEVSHASE